MSQIWVSFSGGADSLALLHWSLTRCGTVTAVHFEHGFRGSASLNDQHFCERICREWNVPLTVVPLNVPANRLPGEGDEAAARRLRLAAWEKLIPPRNRKDSVVLLGHHADDAAENLLIRLFRGCNVSGLTGLRKEKTVNGILFRRPLLDMTRQDILDYLEKSGIREFCVDSTNLENQYFRNYLRNTVLPGVTEIAPYAKGGLYRSCENLSADADYLEQAAETAYSVCRNGKTADWKELHPAILVRVLRKFLPDAIVPDHNLTARVLDCLGNIGTETKSVPANDRYQLVIDPERISLRDTEKMENAAAWNWKTTPELDGFSAELLTEVPDLKDGSAYFDADMMPEVLYLTDWREGDTVLSFDGKRKNLKKLFCDRHIPAQRRKVLRGADGIVYMAPDVRNSAEAPVTTSTKQILRITCHEEK